MPKLKPRVRHRVWIETFQSKTFDIFPKFLVENVLGLQFVYTIINICTTTFNIELSDFVFFFLYVPDNNWTFFFGYCPFHLLPFVEIGYKIRTRELFWTLLLFTGAITSFEDRKSASSNQRTILLKIHCFQITTVCPTWSECVVQNYTILFDHYSSLRIVLSVHFVK